MFSSTRSKAALFLALLAIAIGWRLFVQPRPAATNPALQGAARESVEITVYDGGFAMVREVRPLELDRGENVLSVPDISRALDPQSIMLRWANKQNGQPALVSHTYDAGISRMGDLLDRYMGREVELVRYTASGKESARERGVLMAQDGGKVAVQTGGSLYLDPAGTIALPGDQRVATIPRLSVQVKSQDARPCRLELTYLTRGLSWSPDYVAIVAQDERSLALECWGTVINKTAVAFPEARVSLIAGSANRSAAGYPMWDGSKQPAMRFVDGTQVLSDSAGALEGPPEIAGEFHVYRISDRTSISPGQLNRLLLFSRNRVPVQRDYSVSLPRLVGWDSYYGRETSRVKRLPVQVSAIFLNNSTNGLGLPLPRGTVRVYQPDASGALRYAGAAGVQDTPAGQRVNLTLSNAFDLVAEQRIVQRQRVDPRTVRSVVEVSVYNQKASEVRVRLVQPFSGEFRVRTESRPHVNLDARQAQWDVRVPAGTKVKVIYSVDLGA